MLYGCSFFTLVGASLIQVAIGMLWYCTPFFGALWYTTMGISCVSTTAYLCDLAGSFLIALAMTQGLAFLIRKLAITRCLSASALALQIWFSFIGGIQLSCIFFQNKPILLAAIDGGYYLVSMIIVSCILAKY